MTKLIFMVFVSTFFTMPVFAFNDKVTHPVLTEIAIVDAELLCETMNDLWMDECARYKIVDKTNGEDRDVMSWIKLGAELEDSYARSLFHFHDALSSNPWSFAGFSEGPSAILWAQDETLLDNDWSWKDAQDKYWSALVASSSEERDENFGQLFRGLGHQMHLLQDMAVPAHVRIDAHPADALGLDEYEDTKYFETWVKEFDLEKIGFQYVDGVWSSSSLTRPTASMKTMDGFSPVVNYFDADVYDGNSASASTAQGLSEYSSSNFFSTDTVFDMGFNEEMLPVRPFPRSESTNLQRLIDGEVLPTVIYGEDNVPFEAIYLCKVADGEQFDHLARAGYLESEYTDEEKIFYQDEYMLNFYLDGECHKDYARKLLPRAVGYSAAMLDYFFRARGKVSGVEILDADGDVVGMDVRFANMTEGESLVDPRLAITGRYHLNSEDWNFTASMQKVKSVELNDEGDFVLTELNFESVVDLPPSDDASFSESGTTTVFGEAISAFATDKEYLLAFKGELGGEPDAVGAARVELGWNEEWNQELVSNHPWYVSSDSTDAEAEFWRVEESKLQMRNVRPAGEVSEQYNEIVLDEGSIAGADGTAGVEFPFEITPETVLVIGTEQYEMTSGLPVEDCPSSVSRQELLVKFDAGYPLHVLLPGSTSVFGFYVQWLEGRCHFQLGKVMQDYGFLSEEKRVSIAEIGIRQELGELCSPATEDQVQTFALDYIRVM